VDLHNRHLVLDTFKTDTLIIMTDFSANFDCEPSAQLNSATSEHALLEVFLVHHSPSYLQLPNGEWKRNSNSIAWDYWETKQKGRLGIDNFFHGCCLEDIIQHYHAQRLTDGCPAQYKCRKNCQLLVGLAVKYGLQFDHVISPTAKFKTGVDDEGKTAKGRMRQLKKFGLDTTRAKNDGRCAWLCTPI
jgi:hypothetical protein